MRSRTPLVKTGLRRVLSSPVVTALATPHDVDRYLELLHPTLSVHEVRAEITAVRHQTSDSVTLALRPNGNWQGFQAGQFVRLTVEINGVRQTRCYSPANSAHTRDDGIELTVKAHPTGYVSRFLRDKARAGMIVTLSQADGSFALPAHRPPRILLISAGSGITPMMSMLRTLCDESHTGRITFLHYSSAAKDLIYAGELATIAGRYPNVELLRAFVEPGQGGELQGLFQREQISGAVPDYTEAATFLCGPPAMMEIVQRVWAEDGINERLYLEHFTAPPVVLDTGHVDGDVRFARSERFIGNTGTTLLDQAEAAGLRPEAGCRMGICHTCTCRKISGTVRNVQTGVVSSTADEDIQLCINVPIGTVTLAL